MESKPVGLGELLAAKQAEEEARIADEARRASEAYKASEARGHSRTSETLPSSRISAAGREAIQERAKRDKEKKRQARAGLALRYAGHPKGTHLTMSISAWLKEDLDLQCGDVLKPLEWTQDRITFEIIRGGE